MNDSPHDEPDDPSAPPGAACATHPEREAHFTCPRCGSYACVFCWHPSLQRCDACLRRDPAAAAPPIPWEHGSLSLTQRYLRTLAAAFAPARTAPSFARIEVRPAVIFWLLSAVPLSLLAGIVPHTRTLLFEGGLAVRVLSTAGGGAIAVDVVRAMFAQLWLDGVHLVGCLLPYVSLVRAYAGPERAPFAIRVILYRAWLHPFAVCVAGLMLAVAPSSGDLSAFAAFIPVGASVLFMMAMAYTGRLACGLGMLWSIVLMGVAVVVALFVGRAAYAGLMAVLPEIPAELSSM